MLIGDQDVTQPPPCARPVNTLFQDYALFPHMSGRDSMAYAPMVRSVPRAERERRADELLALVQLPAVASSGQPAVASQRWPASGDQPGGQPSCRLASASGWRWRARIDQPPVLLLDRSLDALDLKLREQMQTELKALQRQLGVIFLNIAHDQHEALSMSDHNGVLHLGKLEQVGTPHEVHNAPRTRFVAPFVGAAHLADVIEAHDEPFARFESLNGGKPVACALGAGRWATRFQPRLTASATVPAWCAASAARWPTNTWPATPA
jgi:putative spermidine/putrescine transport system ATP-binding protein